MTTKNLIAVDMGAESGRVMQIGFDGEALHLEQVHRFPNTPVKVGDTLHWNALGIWHNIEEGIHKAEANPASIGVDTWGVDFALLDRDGGLLANPVHYRDHRTDDMMEWVWERVPRRTVFARTGIQMMQINALYQLASLVKANSVLLDNAATYLTIADLFNYWLTGSKTCEFTHVTSMQLYNPHTGTWDTETMNELGIPTHIFPQILQPGTQIGEYHGIPVTLPACHDTGSAVVACPTTDDNFAYLSSGTWSLIGLEMPHVVINDASYEANLTNEGGVEGTFRLLKNVMGLWLAQQCRATWMSRGEKHSYEQLAQMAVDATPFMTIVDPDHSDFLAPGDMPNRIAEFAARTNQRAPETVGDTVRTVYESLALKYRYVLDGLKAATNKQVDRLHIIGGGSQIDLLNQMTADATGIPVVAGPTEATALGNAIVQMISLGLLDNVAQGREMLARTVQTKIYKPQNTAAWDEQYARFTEMVAGV